MAITIRAETARGDLVEDVADPEARLPRLLALADDDSFCCLRFIDPYGDTIFNGLQMPMLIAELRRLEDRVCDPDDVALLAKLRQAAKRCETGSHLFLKFYGD